MQAMHWCRVVSEVKQTDTAKFVATLAESDEDGGGPGVIDALEM